MHIWQWIFGISCFLVFYNYAGYAILVLIINRLEKRLKKTGQAPPAFYPSVSFIVAAYNEEDCIRPKILNTLAQDFPEDKIEFIFVTDGSSDNTPGIIRQFPAIRLLHNPERGGKSAALDRAVREARMDILIVSDANTILNKDAVKNIARHYQDPKVGGVAGEKKVISPTEGTDSVGASEGLYWKYESYLKRLDSDFYSVAGAAGELFSLRRNLYEPLPPNVILDDFVISLKVAQKGYAIRYEPEAYAMELPSFSLKDEQTRKIRIAAGGFQSIGMLASLLAFWRHPRLTFLYVSHRVLRWTLSPLCLILAFVANGVLALRSPGPPALQAPGILFKALFIGQLLFYGLATLAALFPGIHQRSKLAKLAYYFAFMNISVIRGFFRFLGGRQAAAWEKAKRAQQTLQSE